MGQNCTLTGIVSGEGVAGLSNDFRASEFIAIHSDGELVALIKAGRDPDAPTYFWCIDATQWGIPDATDHYLFDVFAHLRTLQSQ